MCEDDLVWDLVFDGCNYQVGHLQYLPSFNGLFQESTDCGERPYCDACDNGCKRLPVPAALLSALQVRPRPPP